MHQPDQSGNGLYRGPTMAKQRQSNGFFQLRVERDLIPGLHTQPDQIALREKV